MNPGLYFAIGRKARDLLFKDYAQKQPLQLQYQSFNWSFDFSCQIEGILPGLNTVFRVIVPNFGKAEVQYLRDFMGLSAGLGLKANPATGFEPIANISGVIGTTLVSVGADLCLDMTRRILDNFSASLSFNCDFLVASLSLNDSFDSVEASFYHELNPPSRTAVAAELKHRFSEDATTLTIGAQHALFPFTTVKARMNTDGEVSAVLRQQVWQRFYVSVAGDMDLRDSSNIPRIGISMALNP